MLGKEEEGVIWVLLKHWSSRRGFGIEIEMLLVLHCSVNGSFGNDV
jgi:hypothetical protein